MIRNLSIEIKIIISIVLFTLFIVALERYQLSENVIEQFVVSKKSKNRLLIDTISPIVSLNIALGLNDANKEYLNQIVKQNSDVEFIEVLDHHGQTIYSYNRTPQALFNKDEKSMNDCMSLMIDSITQEPLGSIYLHFFDTDYQNMLHKSRVVSLQIFLITFLLLSLFVFLIKREFKDLKQLGDDVTAYDPKRNNFPMTPSERVDEIGIIHNAIVSMVKRISSHSKLLDEMNASLEQKVKKRTEELESLNLQLEALSMTDSLTMLPNRRHFEQYFQEMIELSKRKNVDISVIMCDVDYFKQVNDTYGHEVGDDVLKAIARLMQDALKRSTDFVARYGGEEFIIVLYDTDMHVAKTLCQEIQNNMNVMQGFEFRGIKTKPVTMSFGVSSSHKGNHDYDDLVKFADQALYQAKENGRDAIVLYKS